MSIETDTRVLPEVVMTDELAAAIKNTVDAADVKSLLISAAEKQFAVTEQLAADQAAAEKATADKVAADQAAAEAAAKANQVFTRTEVIGGKEFTFTASTEGEVDRQALAAYKVAFGLPKPEPVVERVPDPAAEKAAAEAEVLAKVELERKFRSGEISASDYLQQSGAVNDYLKSQGVDVAALKEVVEETAEKKAATAFEQSWIDATGVFRTSAAGADWPGGDKNRELLGLKLAAMGLTNAEDKVAALAAAYADMKKTGLYFPNGDGSTSAAAVAASADPAVVAAKAAADAVIAAKAADDARVATALKNRSTSSSLFGASSGASGAPVVAPSTFDAKAAIPSDASPQAIMEAWKTAQLAKGVDPNEAFIEANKARAMK